MMMNDIPKPEISPAFTIEDIHKIREWLYERRKGMTPQEICEDTHNRAQKFLTRRAQPVDPAIRELIDSRMEAVREKYKLAADV